MLGQPGQATVHVPYKRQPAYRATHRCVSRAHLHQHIRGIVLLRSDSGGVSAEAGQQPQETKCLELQAVKCLQAGDFTCMLNSVYLSFALAAENAAGCFAFLDCLRGAHTSMCTNGAVSPGTRRQRGRKGERCSPQ